MPASQENRSVASSQGCGDTGGSLPAANHEACAKHTPGEWRVVGPDPATRNPNMGLWSVEGAANVANDCTLADAALISAAKPLLEKAAAFLRAYDATFACDTAERFDAEASFAANRAEQCAADELRAAISKAEGQ